MKYKITHTTTYQYTSAVSICQNVVILTPRDSATLTCLHHRLTIRPTPTSASRRIDAFGNVVHAFSLEETHSQLSITAVSRVDVKESQLSSGTESFTVADLRKELNAGCGNEWLKVAVFLFNSPRIRKGQIFSSFARRFFPSDASLLQAIKSFNTHMHESFVYDKDATHVDTKTEEAFEGGRGVCQDFAHIAIACLRSIGIPARYVSGYLRTEPPEGRERLIGADQSHAWLSVYAGETIGWVDIDPTNDCVCSTDHISVATGRDYSDVVPVRGIFLGGGDTSQAVSVDVAPI